MYYCIMWHVHVNNHNSLPLLNSPIPLLHSSSKSNLVKIDLLLNQVWLYNIYFLSHHNTWHVRTSALTLPPSDFCFKLRISYSHQTMTHPLQKQSTSQPQVESPARPSRHMKTNPCHHITCKPCSYIDTSTRMYMDALLYKHQSTYINARTRVWRELTANGDLW